MYSSLVERCPDKTEVNSPILFAPTKTRRGEFRHGKMSFGSLGSSGYVRIRHSMARQSCSGNLSSVLVNLVGELHGSLVLEGCVATGYDGVQRVKAV